MKIDARGKQCPLPVMDAKEGLKRALPGEVVEVCVDNEIAVQNLTKMAKHKGLAVESQKKEDHIFFVRIRVGEEDRKQGENGSDAAAMPPVKTKGEEQAVECCPDAKKKGLVVALSSACMGQGDDVLGAMLMKSFVYALAGQDELPDTILLYNGGVKLACEGAQTLDDLRQLEAEGVEILACGTCLNHYGLTEKLGVGSITNMYEIAQCLTQALTVVKP